MLGQRICTLFLNKNFQIVVHGRMYHSTLSPTVCNCFPTWYMKHWYIQMKLFTYIYKYTPKYNMYVYIWTYFHTLVGIYPSEHYIHALCQFSFWVISWSFYESIHPLIHPSVHPSTYTIKIIRRLVLIKGSQGLPRVNQIWSMSDSFFTTVRTEIPMALSQKEGGNSLWSHKISNMTTNPTR